MEAKERRMRRDEPTLPPVGGFYDDPDAATEREGVAFSEAPTWPLARERRNDPFGSDRYPKRRVRGALFRISLGINVLVLVGLLSYLLLSQAGAFPLGGFT